MQLVLELEESFRLVLVEPRERDTGHLRHDFRDHVLVDGADGLVHRGTPCLLDVFLLLAKLLGVVSKAGSLLVIGVLHGFVLVDGESFDLLLEFGEVRGLGHALQSQSCACLIDHVDRLVGLDSRGDVSVRELDGRAKCFVRDLDSVV